MKILVAGDWHSELHEEVVSHALSVLGHEVAKFKWHHYFQAQPGTVGRMWGVAQRAQNKYVAGPIIARMNRDLLEMALQLRPEMVFIYRGTHITSNTLRFMREEIPACVLVGYNNDDPFAPQQPAYLWRHFLRAIPEYDLVLAYRHANLAEYRAAGAQRVELLRSWYVPERNHPILLADADRTQFETDVVFVGHYEDDQRLEYLEEIVRQGFKLRLFGPHKYWASALARSDLLRPQLPLKMVWGNDYNRALCGAKIALCFFSKLNRDTYTRRCFEIPATRTFLLSEYSDDLAGLFGEGAEAEYFRTRQEMMEKIRRYVKNDESRKVIADAGYARVRGDQHDVSSRMQMVVNWAIEVAQVRKLASG